MIKIKRMLFLVLMLVGNSLFSDEDKIFKDEKKVVQVLETYMSSVDQKDINGIQKHLSLPFVLHFDSDQAVNVKTKDDFESLFDNWKNSSKSDFRSTRFESIEIDEVFSNFLCVADVTYSRLDDQGNIIRKERALYHFVKGERFSPFLFLLKWWKRWRIYMITNVDLSED